MHAQRIHRMIKLGLGIDEADEEVSVIKPVKRCFTSFQMAFLGFINPSISRPRMLRMTARCHHWRGLRKMQAGWKR